VDTNKVLTLNNIQNDASPSIHAGMQGLRMNRCKALDCWMLGAIRTLVREGKGQMGEFREQE
jgi:hypothetical protein